MDAYYNKAYQQIVMKLLPFLRGERRRENPDEQKLDEEVRKASQLREELEKELESVRADVENIRKTGKEVGSEKGARAAVRTAVHFDNEAKNYEKNAKKWLLGVAIGYIVVIALLVYLGLSTSSYMEQFFTLPDTIDKGVIWGAIISKLVIIAAVWYGLSFIIKNYNVNAHLAAVNRHRTAVARTLEDFVAVEQQQEKPRLSEILQNSTEAMFKNVPIGFISKIEKQTSNPILQIVNDIMGAGDR